MKKILEKYYGIKKDLEENLEDFYIFQLLEQKLEEHDNLEIDIGSEECLFKITKRLFEHSNIKASEIIERLLNMLECQDIELHDIDKLKTRALIELISNNATDFKGSGKKCEIFSNFNYKGLNCVFMRYKNKYMVICETSKFSNDPIIESYDTLEDLLYDFIDLKLDLED